MTSEPSFPSGSTQNGGAPKNQPAQDQGESPAPQLDGIPAALVENVAAETAANSGQSNSGGKQSKGSEAKRSGRTERSREKNWEEWRTGREPFPFLRSPLVNCLVLGALFLTSYVALSGVFSGLVESIPEWKLGGKINMALVAGLFVADAVLPFEQSQLGELAISSFGKAKGFAICFFGLVASSTALFFVSSRIIFPILRSHHRTRDIQKQKRAIRKWGPWAIAVSRGVPVLSEMVSVYLGSYRTNWWTFLLPTCLSSLSIAGFWAVFGTLATKYAFLMPLIGLWGGMIGVLLVRTKDSWLPLLTGSQSSKSPPGQSRSKSRKSKRRRR